jgi:hypothetical protein
MDQQHDQDKMILGAVASSSSTERLGSSWKRYSETHLIDEEASAGKMARMRSVRAPSPPNELIQFGSPVLDIVMDFLGSESLKNCAEVCKSWAEAARKALRKRCSLDVNAFFMKMKLSELYRVEFYSSWILNYPPPPSKPEIGWTEFLSKRGKGTKSLTLRGLTIDKDCRKWIRRLLCVWCTNVEELSLEFKDGRNDRNLEMSVRQELERFRQYLDDRDKVTFEQIWMVKGADHAFTPYPLLPNIQTLRVGKRADQMTSYLSINVLLSCSNLKHLFVSEVSGFGDSRDEEDVEDNGGFRIIRFLSQRPAITMKLETFEWQDDSGRCSTSFHNDDIVYSDWDVVVSRFGSVLRNRKAAGVPALRFGDNLKSLHWNVLELDKEWNTLIPGRLVLEQVAGNIRTLDLRKVKIDGKLSTDACLRDQCGIRSRYGVVMDNFTRLSTDLPYVFPLMPKLSTIQIDSSSSSRPIHVSLSDLMDAAPNLTTLEISGCESCDIRWKMPVANREFICEGTRFLSEMPRRYTNLKSLKTGISLRNVEVLQRTMWKFPNLEELSIGVEGMCETQLKLDSIFETLERLQSLRRFKWTICGPVDLAGILKCFIEAAGRMPSLRSCHLRFICSTLDSSATVESREFFKNRIRLLWKILETKRSSCRFIVTTNLKEIFEMRSDTPIFEKWPLPSPYRSDWKLLLLTFIRINGLPIEMRYSPKEEEDM